ncbi:MAG: TlpA family protein disulfide reductase [Vicingaceae bacterium]|nr:TlpA family protein disulfide reductase [Vicingaceae bacterium]
MLKKTILIYFFCVVSSLTFAGNSVIKGNAKKFSGNELTVYQFKDYLTEVKEKIGFTKINTDGSFNFEFETNQIEKIELTIEDKSTWFFIEPGGVYNLILDYDEELNKSRIYDRLLSLRFSFPAPTELNQLIAKFNRKYDEFIDKNETTFLKRDGSIAPLINDFEKKITAEFNTYKNTFVSDYITYSIASIFNSIDISYTKRDSVTFDKASIYLKYLHNKPIKYNNPEYLNFYKNFFKGELKNLTLKISGMDITKAINEQNSVEALSKALSKYPFLENEAFKSLFMINGLREIYNDKYFTQKNILSILENIKTNSIYPEQQKIAANVIEKLTIKKLAKGSKAPDFELLTDASKKITLADFAGKYVYINFWTTWSIPSLKEMKIMEVLHKKYNSKIEFISICTDNDKSKMTTFLKENPTMKWTFLHIGESRVLLQKYEVKTFPTYILVGKEGEIIKFPAPRPSSGTDRPNEENLERLFYELK